MSKVIVWLVFVLSATSAVAQSGDRITVMTYNVENFFDDIDDPRYPNDRETLNDTAYVSGKAASIARVINRFDNGKGPDVLVLTEIESQVALSALKDALSSPSDYKTEVFFDADPNRPGPKPDFRGIDVAILARLPLAPGTAPKPHVIDLTGESACIEDDGSPGSTRDAIEASFELPGGETLSVFGVHFPSGGNPIVCREIAAKTVRDLANDLPSDHTVLLAGDFNFNCRDDEQVALNRIFAGWALPVQLDNGCVGNGSHWFSRENTWSYLDVIAERPQASPWRTEMRTFRLVINDFEQLFFQDSIKRLRPKKFRLNTSNPANSGTSDHFPVAVDLVK
ncbi:endonuclease/exonuclease/phosphatase family protein [uncultured Tateyamaria sp.]|uniref:endonuclease/exonuclease/phosphatase family protein n=1 Tax=uncultured Tateyamaria sp. TaxID=455651 RepID=UPI0026018B5D|nr:endonuclease/exonuclease/phosphatase family protein [uncultured Tateyamaria sp.]